MSSYGLFGPIHGDDHSLDDHDGYDAADRYLDDRLIHEADDNRKTRKEDGA